MFIKTDFEADWTAELRRIMEDDWAMDLAAVMPQELAVLFFHAGKRRIEPRPRAVKISTAFACPAEYQSRWAALVVKIEAGDDLSPHLSLRIEDVMGKDQLLMDWGVYHLHLGQAPHPKNQSFVERTGPVVFGFPTVDAFHAIGVYEHGAWSDGSVIEIMHSNWPHLTQRAQIQGTGMSLTQNYTDEDRRKLRAVGINLITPLSDGTCLSPVGGGYSGNGISAEGVIASDRERELIKEIQNQIHAQTDVIEQALRAEGYDGGSEVIARLNFNNGAIWVTFEGFTATVPIE
ncbi:hypothetical protein [Pseudomonas syringae]|uniref:hypothetical protein n=1 Tax=Pseudomonas syringae TaxID=317 RepID=UPI0007608EED|nr:hypothetical protein [Pseudomonas syringae]KWS19011.1 hypothetical protein AL062_24480 [Pseudomonas syringae pv. syringae]RXT63359.1 hypothetical protein B1F74_15070 [Pseudomonas syringae]